MSIQHSLQTTAGLAFLMSWFLSMAAGKEWNLKGQSCDPRWDILTPEIYSYCRLPFNSCQPPVSNQGQQWARGPTWLHTSGVPQIQQYLHFSELSGTVFCLQPLLRCLHLLILPHVTSKVDEGMPAALVCINPTFLLMLLLLVLSSPSLTVLFYCCLQTTVCKTCLSPASSRSHSVMWSCPHLFHHTWMCMSLSQNTIHNDRHSHP